MFSGSAAESLAGLPRSEALGQVLLARFYALQQWCAVLALIHLLAEWLYLSKAASRFRVVGLCSLFALGLLGGYWLHPRLESAHLRRYTQSVPADERAAAAGRARAFSGATRVFNVLLLCGVGVYLWRVSNPLDVPRFVPSHKFRG